MHFSIVSIQFFPLKFHRLGIPNFQLKTVYWWGGGGLFDYSVKPGPDFVKVMLGLVKLVTRTAKARFGQVDDQVGQVEDQVGQGQGQELDKKLFSIIGYFIEFFDQPILTNRS